MEPLIGDQTSVGVHVVHNRDHRAGIAKGNGGSVRASEMVFIIEKSQFCHASRTAVNDTCTLMAAVTSGTSVNIYKRDQENPSWSHSATCSDALSDKLMSGVLRVPCVNAICSQ